MEQSYNNYYLFKACNAQFLLALQGEEKDCFKNA